MHSNLDKRDERMHERLHKHSQDIDKLTKLIDSKTMLINKKIDTELTKINT